MHRYKAFSTNANKRCFPHCPEALGPVKPVLKRDGPINAY